MNEIYAYTFTIILSQMFGKLAYGIIDSPPSQKKS